MVDVVRWLLIPTIITARAAKKTTGVVTLLHAKFEVIASTLWLPKFPTSQVTALSASLFLLMHGAQDACAGNTVLILYIGSIPKAIDGF